MNYNLLEFGGSVDLLATAICDFDTPSRSYKTGEVVLNLEDIHMRTEYFSSEKNARQSVDNHLKYSEYLLDNLVFSVVPLEKQLYELFAETTKETIRVLKKEQVVCLANGRLLPLCAEGKPVNDSFSVEEVETFTIVEMNGVVFIDSDDFVFGQEYSVSYEIEKEMHSIGLGNKDLNIPYLKLQISFRGNGDKNEIAGFLIVDKAHISFSPIINFVKDNVCYCSLAMSVIASEKKPRLVV